jgi:hypothetical protein
MAIHTSGMMYARAVLSVYRSPRARASATHADARMATLGT